MQNGNPGSKTVHGGGRHALMDVPGRPLVCSPRLLWGLLLFLHNHLADLFP